MPFVFTTVLACLILMPGWLFAQEKPSEDVRILIDVSGSMKQSDPKNLRVPALNLLLNLLPAGSTSGAWIFGTDVKPLVILGNVDDRWKQAGLAAAKQVSSSDLYTNIGLGLSAVSKGWGPAQPNARRSIILLTDGMVDVSNSKALNETARAQLLGPTLEALAATGVKIHTIALSDQADTQLLRAIATKTDGFFATAYTADDLLKIFLQAFDQSIEQEQVPLNDNMFEIDAGIEEFTALVFRLPGSAPSRIKDPNGHVYDQSNNQPNISWYSEDAFDLITVNDPDPGTWQLMAKVDPENRVTVVSDLAVRIDGLPNNILQGDTLDISLYLEQSGELVDRVEFLSLLEVAFKQTYLDTGKVWDGKLTSHNAGTVRVPKDGRFNAKLGKTLSPGAHEFVVEIDGKTFVRRKSKKLMVHAEVLDVVTVAEEDSSGATEYFLNAVPVRGLVDNDSLSVSVRVSPPKSGVYPLEPEQTPFGSYKIPVPPEQGEGTYEVMLKVVGRSTRSTDFNILQGPYQINYGAATKAASEPVSVKESAEPVSSPQPTEMPTGDTLKHLPVPEVPEAPTTPNAQTQTPEPVAAESVPKEKPEAGSAESDEEVSLETVEALDNITEEPPASEDKGSFFSSRLFMIIAGVVGNLLIALIGYVVYRKVALRKESKEVALDSGLISALEDAEASMADDTQAQPDAGAPEESKDAPAAEEDDAIGDMLDDLDDVFSENSDADKKN